MSSTSLKHQARLREWSVAVQDCRGSGLPVSRWCRENGITATTYYRWEREVLAIAETSRKLPEHPPVQFAELPVETQPLSRNVPKPSATLHFGNGSLDLYQELTPELVQSLVEALRSC